MSSSADAVVQPPCTACAATTHRRSTEQGQSCTAEVRQQARVSCTARGVCDPAVPHEHAGSCRWPRCSRRSGRAAAPAQAPSNGILSFSILLSYCFFYVGFYIMFLFSLSLNDVDVASWRIMVGCRPTNPHWTCLARPVRSREHSWRFQIHLHLFVHLVASHKVFDGPPCSRSLTASGSS